MNEQPLKTTTTVRSAPSQWLLISAIIFMVAFPTLCLAIALFTPSPYKQWGLAGIFISISTLILYRAIQDIFGTSRVLASLPSSLATFLVLVPFGIWGLTLFN